MIPNVSIEAWPTVFPFFKITILRSWIQRSVKYKLIFVYIVCIKLTSVTGVESNFPFNSKGVNVFDVCTKNEKRMKLKLARQQSVASLHSALRFQKTFNIFLSQQNTFKWNVFLLNAILYHGICFGWWISISKWNNPKSWKVAWKFSKFLSVEMFRVICLHFI